MNRVHDLREAERKPDPGLVRRLEELLEQAKTGELVGFAIATHLRGDATSTAYVVSGGGNLAYLLVALEHLRLRMLLSDDDDADDDAEPA